MPGFKIASAYVEVTPDDTGFEDELRAAIAAASQGVKAEVGLALNDDAVISLDEEVKAAMDLATEKATAQVGLGLKSDAVEALDAEVKAGVDLVEEDAKVKVSVDPKSAQDVQQGLSGLIVGGIAAGAALAPGLILTAASVAVAGLGAMVVKSNADIVSEYHHLANDVGDALQQAAAPLVPAVEESLVQADDAINKLRPDLDSLFTAVEPDLNVFTTGIVNSAEQFLPRFDVAVNNSRGILQETMGGLPQLAAGAGNFFVNLTDHAQSTGRSFNDLEQLTGTALGTAGQVISSFSAAASTALDAVVPAADGVLTAIEKLANPATIGAAGGALAVKAWGAGISSGLQSASDAVRNLSAKADGAGGMLAKLAPAGAEASGALSSMAGVMGGPWGIAIGAGVGLLGGFIASMRESVATAADFTASVSQDSNAVGANTEAVISQTLAKANLSDLNQKLGVDNATLIAYAAGDKQAQQEVTAAYNAKIAAMQAQQEQEQRSGSITKVSTLDTNNQSAALAEAKAKLDQVTGAVADAVKQQNEQTASLQAAEKATDVFTQQVNAQKLALAQSAQTALVNATALNESLAPQDRLTGAAIDATLAYQQETSATSQFSDALDALYGKYGDTSQAQAAFTTSLIGLKGQITAGTDAVNLDTKAGAANYTAFQQVASAAETYSEKLQQQTGSASQAQAALRAAVVQIDAMATKAHLTSAQVQTLNTELFGVKNASDIKISVDDSSVNSALSATQQLIKALDNMPKGSIPTVGSRASARATGGPVKKGESYIVGDGGQPEPFVPDTDGYIYPTVAAGERAVANHNARVAASTPATAFGQPAVAGAAVQNTFVFNGSQYPTTEQMAQLNMQYATALGGV